MLQLIARFENAGMGRLGYLLAAATVVVSTAAPPALAQVRLTKLLAASSLFQALGGGWTPDGKLSSLQAQPQP